MHRHSGARGVPSQAPVATMPFFAAIFVCKKEITSSSTRRRLVQKGNHDGEREREREGGQPLSSLSPRRRASHRNPWRYGICARGFPPMFLCFMQTTKGSLCPSQQYFR